MNLLTRGHLSRLPARPLSGARNRTKADVLLVEWEGEALVVKDFRPRGFLVRNTIGRFSVARECRAYARLQGVAGIARFAGRIDAHALAYAYRDGLTLTALPRNSLPGGFFEACERLLSSVHERGVAIADLHHRNVLVATPGNAPGGTAHDRSAQVPALVDFSLALVRPSAWNLPARWLFARAQELDRIALARIRARYESSGAPPSAIRTNDADALTDPVWYTAGRRIKSVLRRLRGRRP